MDKSKVSTLPHNDPITNLDESFFQHTAVIV